MNKTKKILISNCQVFALNNFFLMKKELEKTDKEQNKKYSDCSNSDANVMANKYWGNNELRKIKLKRFKSIKKSYNYYKNKRTLFIVASSFLLAIFF